MKQLKNVRTEMRLNVLAYNLRRMITIVGVAELLKIMEAIVLSVLHAFVNRFQRPKLRTRIDSVLNYWRMAHGTMRPSTI